MGTTTKRHQKLEQLKTRRDFKKAMKIPKRDTSSNMDFTAVSEISAGILAKYDIL